MVIGSFAGSYAISKHQTIVRTNIILPLLVVKINFFLAIMQDRQYFFTDDWRSFYMLVNSQSAVADWLF